MKLGVPFAFLLILGCGEPPQPKSAVANVSEPDHLLPARVRRLSNAEYENSVHALLGTDAEVASRLPPDIRDDGFTQNDINPVHSAWASRLAELARELAEQYVLSPQSDVCPDPKACAASFVSVTGRRAFRRPLTDDEKRSLMALYTQAEELDVGKGSGVAGARAVVTALLQAPSMIYLPETGEATNQVGVLRLTDFEIASALSFMLRGGPPDEALLQSAQEGKLTQAERRRAEALRLLAQSDTRHQFRRFVTEWLEVDQLLLSSKDEGIAADYDLLKNRMLEETHAFVDEVMVHGGASLEALLTAGFSSVGPELARYYGLPGWGPRVPSAERGRLGVLQHASFLSAHAHPTHTSPVLRGDFVLRRLLCIDLPRPTELGIETVMPPAVPSQTTRERFSAHAINKGCADCHSLIDPLGYAFENFDAAGQGRSEQEGRVIDSSGEIAYNGLSMSFESSADLSHALSARPEAAQCFRRYAFRFFTSQADPDLDDTLERVAHGLSPRERPNLLSNLVAFAASDEFILRRADP